MKTKGVIFFMLLCSSFTKGFSQIAISNLGEMVQKAVSEVRCAGATVLVAKGDEIIHHKGYGHAQLSFNIPATQDTRFRLVGPNQIIQAGIVMKLLEQQKISLDDKINNYLKNLPPGYELITIKHLLTSTSGIPDYYTMGDEYEGLLAMPQAPDEILAKVIRLPLNFTPGSKFGLSNTNLLLLTAIMERVSGKSYESLLKDFLMPLNLEATGIIMPRNIVSNLSEGYYFDTHFDSFYPVVASQFNYDASLRTYSTTGDLFRIWRGLVNNALMSKESFRLMTSKEEAARNNSGNFGYLIRMNEYAGKAVWGMFGSQPGYSSSLKYLPEHDITIIVLTNTANEREAERIASQIARQYVAIPAERKPMVVKVDYDRLPIDPAEMESISGTYKVYGTPEVYKGSAPSKEYLFKRTFRVFDENGRLLVQHFGDLPRELWKQKDGSYQIMNFHPESKLIFSITNGEVIKVKQTYDNYTYEDSGTRVGDSDVSTFYSSYLQWIKPLEDLKK